MMGKHQPQKNLFSSNVDLDERVGTNHPLRKVVQKVDFSFVCQEVKDCYVYNGKVGLDLEIFLKLMFLLFWDDIRNERELMRMLPECLDCLWFLGYTLDDDVPHHSVLSKARAVIADSQYGTAEVMRKLQSRGIPRGYLMEGSFAQGASPHHFKRSRWRRLHRQRIQDWLICSIQNIKILITHGPPSNTPADGLAQVEVELKTLYAGLRSPLLAPFNRQDRLKPKIACSLDCQPIG